MAYKVLWVDDEFDTDALQEVADSAANRGIDMNTACKSAEEALAHLQHPKEFDAIILDARFLVSTNDTLDSKGGVKGLGRVIKRIQQLKDTGDYIPTFIFSGQPDTFKSEWFAETYEEYEVFQKGLDNKRLFDAIIHAVNERVETQVKLKYAPLFDICVPKYMFDSSDLTNRLLNYAVQVEHNDTKKPEYLNDIRKLIEILFKKSEQLGLLRSGIESLNEKSRFLCNNKMQAFIPPYVQESIRYILRCTQEGSHYGVADADMRNGVAPFLFRSLFFSLSTVLIWWKQLIDSDFDKDALRRCVESIQIDSDSAIKGTQTDESEPEVTPPLPYTYVVERDSEGFYHCGPYLMSSKHGQAIEGRTVTVLEENDNTGKKGDVYPRFAKRVQEVRK